MKFFYVCFGMTIGIFGIWVEVSTAQQDWMPDANLRAAVLEDLIGQGVLAIGATTFTQANLADSRFADLLSTGLTDPKIADLTGLQYATSLKRLHLNHHNIEDLSPLAGLTNLTNLRLHDNRIEDLSPLAGLTNLTGDLLLWRNSIPLCQVQHLLGLNPELSVHLGSHYYIEGLNRPVRVKNLKPFLASCFPRSRTPSSVPIVETSPLTNNSLTVRRIDQRTVTLSWKLPTSINAQAITEYQYSVDDSQTWTSMPSTGPSITITRDGLGALSRDKFKVRALRLNADSTARRVIIVISAPKRRIVYECPVGWTRESVFGETKKALIYELKVNVDQTNRVSIYELQSLAIYVHPEENLETLDGWYLTTGILYNHDHENKFHLTAENSVIDEHGFAHIKNPEDTPIRMGTLGFIGQSLPSFDYRLYDDKGMRVDFGISCYKEGGLTFRLYNTQDPRVVRVLPFPVSEAALDVRMKTLDWNTHYFRTQWTAAIMPDLPDAPAAPSLIKKTVVGTWADLKKQ